MPHDRVFVPRQHGPVHLLDLFKLVCLPLRTSTWASSLSSRSMTTKLDLLSMATYGTTSHPVHGRAPRCPRMQASG
jgi:hypothetical protein